jgi:Mn2+/Fe2+ NRAMP family transporter
LMGELVNTRNTNIMNAIILLVVTILNIILLYTLFWG